MRELAYGVEGKAANLRTFALDEPGHGGACHEYRIVGEGDLPPSCQGDAVATSNGKLAFGLVDIRFQKGPINADGNGVNGIQHEDLLAIIIDRLQGFQSGKYACDDNAKALLCCQDALNILNSRTRARIARNVEGTHTV